MKPMTKEEWDARQSVIRKVVDPETGRTRWAVLAEARPQPCTQEGRWLLLQEGQGWRQK